MTMGNIQKYKNNFSQNNLANGILNEFSDCCADFYYDVTITIFWNKFDIFWEDYAEFYILKLNQIVCNKFGDSNWINYLGHVFKAFVWPHFII